MTFDLEVMVALAADAEKLRQLTGQDHTPEFLIDCEACGGEGAIEIPRPFADDPYFCIAVPCDACAGAGFFMCEAT